MKEIAGAAPDLEVDDAAVARQVEVYACIHHLECKAVLAAEEIHSACALRMRKVADLLPGDFLGGYADAFIHYAVISCENYVLGMPELWI